MHRAKTQPESQTLFEAMLRALAQQGSADALAQLGLLYARRGDRGSARRLWHQASCLGNAWAELSLYELKISTGLSKAEGDQIIAALHGIFKEIGKGRLDPSLGDKAFHVYYALFNRGEALEGPMYLQNKRDEDVPGCENPFCDPELTLAKAAAQSGCLSSENLDKCARLLLKNLMFLYRDLPERFYFLRHCGIDDLDYQDTLTPAMALHELGVAYEHGAKCFIQRDLKTAARLYAEAMLAFTWQEPSSLKGDGSDAANDEGGFSRDQLKARFDDPENTKFAEYLIIASSLATMVQNHEDDLGFEVACDFDADLRSKAGLKLLELWRANPQSRDLKEFTEALKHMAKAGGGAAAEILLGFAQQGEVIAKDEKLITALYELKAKCGDSLAALKLARRLDEGPGCAKDPALAQQWYLKAAAGWHDEALAALADHYAQLAEQGSQDALLRYGHCLEHGLGVAKDPKQAECCYRMLKNQPLKFARLAALAARRGLKAGALAYLKQARQAAKSSSEWKRYLDGVNLECGITAKQDLRKARVKFLGLDYPDAEFDFPDLQDRILRCSRSCGGDQSEDGLTEESLRCDEQTAAARATGIGSLRACARCVKESLAPRPAQALSLRNDLLITPKQAQEAAARLAELLPKLRHCVFDTKITFKSADPDKALAKLRRLFPEGAVITLPTCVCVSETSGGFAKGEDLRFLVLSSKLTEITEPAFAALKPAALPAGTHLQALGVCRCRGKYQVILLHDPSPDTLPFSVAAPEGARLLKRLEDDFAQALCKAPALNDAGIKALRETARHKSLDGRFKGDLLCCGLKARNPGGMRRVADACR